MERRNGQSGSAALPGEVAGRAALLRRRLVFARVLGHALIHEEGRRQGTPTSAQTEIGPRHCLA
jgi:hypothetical protein